MPRAKSLKLSVAKKGWKVTLSGKVIARPASCRDGLLFVEGFLGRTGLVEAWVNGSLTFAWAWIPEGEK